jgi:ferrous iron transport protein A
MKPEYTTLDKLLPGESAIIDSLTDDLTSLRLLDMGCIPGEPVFFEKRAPLGDPIAIMVSGSLLSLRLAEAATIRVKQTAA